MLRIESLEKVTVEGAKLGDSIAVNGVCLTIIELTENSFLFECSPETMRRTGLGDMKVGSECNLERALRFGDRLGGHFVEGHIDCFGLVKETRKEEESLWVYIDMSQNTSFMKYIVSKGYIALDGTSLTVCDVGENWFNVMLIDYTQQHIVLPSRKIGDKVNVEVDILSKYVEKIHKTISPPALEQIQVEINKKSV